MIRKNDPDLNSGNFPLNHDYGLTYQNPRKIKKLNGIKQQMTRWWFHFFILTPIFGEDFHFD